MALKICNDQTAVRLEINVSTLMCSKGTSMALKTCNDQTAEQQ